MKLNRLKHEPGDLLEFYADGLTALGALCERTWHDRLEVVAEGAAAALWDAGGPLHEVELSFVPADATSARDAAREVFPGCPLTFRLAESLRGTPLVLERFILGEDVAPRAPEPAVAEKLWRSQYADTHRWHLTAPFKPGFHFSLISIVRCEIQAMDQHWSAHRLAISLASGEADETLAQEAGFHWGNAQSAGEINWPQPDAARWRELLLQAIKKAAEDEVSRVRARQEISLRRELARIDEYFDSYERELTARAKRGSSENARMKTTERLAAAKAEHQRRRADQVSRHEMVVHPHIDGVLLTAENAWWARLEVERGRQQKTIEAVFVPRSRRWEVAPEGLA